MDDMSSATSSPPPVYDDFNDDDSYEPDAPLSQQPLLKVKPKELYNAQNYQLRRAQSDRPLSKHSQTGKKKKYVYCYL